ncbi:MAG: hypothetical protein HYY06_30640 [Deltaproteobacteria bacterium]|nr:hypothetical protein [Deltaproteobacteria bacterium]
MSSILIWAALGAITGGAEGLFVAIVQLRLKRWRNARLTFRGLPGLRDCVLVALHWPCAVLGLAAGGVAGAIGGWPAAILAGSAGPVLLLAIVTVTVIRASST